MVVTYNPIFFLGFFSILFENEHLFYLLDHMRILILTRGVPGCGKSTWIKQNGLEAYTSLCFSIPCS